MIKKILSVIISILLFATLSACNSSSASVDTDSSDKLESSYQTPSTASSNSPSVCNHTYRTATCTEAKKCSRCGETFGTALGHNYIAKDCTSPRECTRCTSTTTAIGHSFSKATCTSPQKCSRCNVTQGSALGHSDNGNGSCSRCGTSLSTDMKKRVSEPKDGYFGFSYYKNSADGIKLCWQATNLSGKSIKYYTITLYFYNSVGDPAYSDITGKSSKTIKYVGPVAADGDLVIFGIVDYVPVCSKIVVGDIKLEYSDGTTESGWYGYYTTYKNSALK